jgi:nicotinamide-nucleotide amidase
MADVSAAELITRARTAGVLIATAESCTGGLIAGAITEVPGSSDVFDCGFVTYSNGAKTRLLGVSESTLAQHGAVSEPVAAAMALGALARSDAGLAVSVTGIAGPGGGTREKPEGMVCFGLAVRGAGLRTETRQFGPLGRAAVRSATVDHALALLLGALP